MNLPPLPEPRTLSRGDEDGAIQLGYTAAQTRAYAAEAVRVALEAAARQCDGLTGRSYEFDMGRLHSAAAIRALIPKD